MHGDLRCRPVGEPTTNELVRRLVPQVKNLKIGASTDPRADFDPLVTKIYLDRVKAYVAIGVQEGATILVDGRDFTPPGFESGFYMGGCLFEGLRPPMRIYREEIFDPVLCVLRATDWAEALALVDNHEYGNGVAIYTRDGATAPDFASRVQVGMVASTCPSRRRSRITVLAAASIRSSATSASTAPTRFASAPRPRPSWRAGRAMPKKARAW